MAIHIKKDLNIDRFQLIFMEKVCIFCGQRPYNKTKEHVIPKWLIELTGSPKRYGFFGYYNEDKGPKEMHLSFNDFTFPACEKCNKTYSDLEAKTKPVILELLDEKPLDGKDINIILTWFDKVRIGLWLGSLYYNNILGINPNFYIDQGTFSRDRMVLIYKNKPIKKRLNFIGVYHAFQMHPICFTLIINNFAFTNVAKNLLLSENFGLAVLQEDIIFKRGGAGIIKKGSQKISYPLVDFNFEKNCTEFYQPNLSDYYSKQIFSMINDEHREKIFISKSSKIGNIFYHRDGSLIKYPTKKNRSWVPPSFDLPFLEFFRIIGMQSLQIQNHYFKKKSIIFDPKLSSEFKKQQQFALKYNNILLERLEKRDFEEFG